MIYYMGYLLILTFFFLGEAYAALYKSVWYRCFLSNIYGDSVTLFYVDTGHYFRVLGKDLRVLPDR